MNQVAFDRDGWIEDVGHRLRFARKSQKMTQASLAAEVGIPRTTVANIEAGRQGIYADQIWRCAVVLRVPITKLMPEPIK